MIRVTTIHSVLPCERDPIHADTEWLGQTIGELVATYRRDGWDSDCLIVCAVNGRKVEAEDWDRVAPDGAHVVIAPIPGAEFLVALVIQLIVAAIVAVAVSLLSPKPKRPNLPVGREDISSPANNWQRILSTWRQGFPIPLLWGTRIVGGTVLSASSTSSSVWVVLGLCVGRIHKVGNQSAGTLGEEDNLAGASFPSGITIGGNSLVSELVGLPGAYQWSTTASLRMGDDEQQPIRGHATKTSIPVSSSDLNDVGSTVIVTISSTEVISGARFQLEAPGGAYKTDALGKYQPAPVFLFFSWRYPGGAWNVTPGRFYFAYPPMRNRVLFDGGPVIPSGVVGPIDVRVTRGTAAVSGTVGVNSMRANSVQYTGAHGDYAYPGVAHVGIEIRDADKFAGGRPNFGITASGARVRVFDNTIGSGLPSTDRFFDSPDSSSSYNGIWSYPPGRNPAWIVCDMLTSEDALGAVRKTDSEIDWEAFRDWADWCDEHIAVDAVNEALFQADVILDSPTSALDAVMQVMSAGRAKPVMRGTQLSVKYDYALAHGRGTNSVPAKTRSFLIVSGNMTDFQIDYINNEVRPSLIDVQFPDADKSYIWDSEPVEDPDGGQNDPRTFNPLGVTKIAQQIGSVTRRTQAKREGLYMHRANRLLTSRISFRAGPDTLACEVGDLIGVEHIAMSPFDAESFGYRMYQAEAASSDVHLDHIVTLGAGAYQVIYRDTSGDIQARAVTAGSGVYAIGAAISVSGGSVTANKLSPIALGETSKVVRDYLVTRVALSEEMFVDVEAVNWDSDIYTETDIGSDLAGEGGASGLSQSTFYELNPSLAPQVTSIAAAPSPGGGGWWEISWGLPSGQEDAPARIYLKSDGAPVFVESEFATDGQADAVGDPWVRIGETRGTSFATDRISQPETISHPRNMLGRGHYETSATSFVIAVAISKDGVWQLPDEALAVVVRWQEFPALAPPSIRNLAATSNADGMLVTWQTIDSPLLSYYELRGGNDWVSGHRIGRTAQPEFLIPNPMPGMPYMIRARFASGLYSREIQTLSAPSDWAPDCVPELASTDLSAFPGTLSGLTYDSGTGELSISSGEFSGTWITGAFSITYETDAKLLLRYLSRFDYPQTIQEIIDESGDFGAQSGEALWRTLAGREASPAFHGHNFDESIADLDGLISEVSAERGARTYLGEVGTHTRHSLEVSYDAGAYEDWRPERRGHTTARFRLTLYRATTSRQIYITNAKVWQYA